MLSEEENRLLTEVGPTKPMGQLLRRYWMPFAGAAEFETRPIRAVRLLGEDLAAFQDKSGAYGLVQRQCAHRRADLSYGYVEEHGIRCNYHGWLFGTDGGCLARPFEDIAGGRDPGKTRITAYPVREKAGILWTYMGPLPAPELPDWEAFGWNNGFRQVVIAEVPCNWFQAQENSCDPIHFEWMHSNWSARLKDEAGAYTEPHVAIDIEEFDYGFIYKRLKEGWESNHPLWTVGRVALWPNGFYLGDHFEWRVPIDDEHMLSIAWMFNRAPRESEPYVQPEPIAAWRSPIADPETGEPYTSHVMNQDFVAWVGQGAIADRTKEELGLSDRGIVMMRRRYFEQLEVMARGGPLKGVITDPEANRAIPLPAADRDLFVNGLPREAFEKHPVFGSHLRHFIFQHGQPDAVRDAFLAAMGG